MEEAKFPNGLADAMKARGVGYTELARLIGQSKQNVDRWAKWQRKLPVKLAPKIAEVLGTSAAKLLLVADPVARPAKVSRFHMVPLLSWVSAGRLSGAELPPNLRSEKMVPTADLGPGEWIALRVQGDSMNLIAPETSVIFVDLADKRLIEDRFYVFALENGDSTFKRYRGGRKARLQPFSTNPDHETIPVSDGLQVVGRVRRTTMEL